MADEPIADVVARVLAMDERVTPGPWMPSRPATVSAGYGTVVCGYMPSYQAPVNGLTQGDHNAEWIASTRTDAVILAREVARLTAEKEGWDQTFFALQASLDQSRAVNGALLETLQAAEATAAQLADDRDEALQFLHADEAELARLRDGIEALAGELETRARAGWNPIAGRLRAPLAPTTEPTSTETTTDG